MAWMKNALLDICLGIIIAGVICDVSTPGALTWYHIPGGGEALCPCAETVRDTAATMVQARLIAAAIGGVLGLGVGQLVRRKSRRAKGAPPAVS